MNIIGIDMANSSHDYTVLMCIKDNTIVDSHLIRSDSYESTEKIVEEKINEWERRYGNRVKTLLDE